MYILFIRRQTLIIENIQTLYRIIKTPFYNTLLNIWIFSGTEAVGKGTNQPLNPVYRL